MDCKNSPIDYQAAAERLLVALSFIAGKLKERPVPAAQLCAHAFPREMREHWTHETKRRRVRDAVVVARQVLAGRQQDVSIVANGTGYWLTGNHQVMTWYADQRRRRGIQDLVAGHDVAAAVENAGQKSLFPEPPKPSCRYD